MPSALTRARLVSDKPFDLVLPITQVHVHVLFKMAFHRSFKSCFGLDEQKRTKVLALIRKPTKGKRPSDRTFFNCNQNGRLVGVSRGVVARQHAVAQRVEVGDVCAAGIGRQCLRRFRYAFLARPDDRRPSRSTNPSGP
jgi:hypothetical protein